MKKILAKMMIAALIVSTFTACGKAAESTDNQTNEEATNPSDTTIAQEENNGFLDLEEWAIPDITYTYEAPTSEEEADIFVTKIDGISDDFIRGVDISSYVSELRSGVKYYDFEGNEENIFKVLADAGVNYIRIRVWNDPFDEEGHGYGGGNCDVKTAAWMGAYAAKYGIKTCVDFHYSDFWADPNKQMSPKAWEKLSIDDKCVAVSEFTIESIDAIVSAGTDLGMVQIGNETNNGVAGVKSQDNLYRMLAAGCEGARKVINEKGLDTKIAVHFTQIDNHDDTLKKAEGLKKANADYDIFGVSYYTFWHGSFENMVQVLKDIESEYGVKTCIMETSYPYTTEDTDGTGNSISGDGDILTEYPATVQGQAKMIRDVMYYANEAGALGVFYWEPAWISVGEADKTVNTPIWEEFGSGWASSYAGAYDPNDAGKYYGGSSWDNQAMFDATGHPLSSLNVWKYVKYGAKAPIEVLAIKDVKIESPTGLALELPTGVEAVYNDSNLTEKVAVEWNQEDIDSIDVNQNGKYQIRGTASNGWEITAEVKIASVNYIKNGSFEDVDTSMWDVEYVGENDPTDIQNKSSDAQTGDCAFHYWSTNALDFTVSQTLTDLHSGSYTASCYLQGGDMGASEDVYFFVKINGQEVAHEQVSLTGWVEWKNPLIQGINVNEGDEVIVGVHVTGDAKGWGTIDDIEFY